MPPSNVLSSNDYVACWKQATEMESLLDPNLRLRTTEVSGGVSSSLSDAESQGRHLRYVCL